MADDNVVHPTVITAWQLIGVAISVMAAFGLALWTVITDQNRANETILQELHNNYIPKSSHQDLADRLTREVSRVDELAKSDLPRAEFDRWADAEKHELDTMRNRITRHEESDISRREFDGLTAERARQIDSLRQQIEAIRVRIDGIIHDRTNGKTLP